jgi:hypothetical protein
MLSRLKFEFDPLITEILDQFPDTIWESKTTTFLDPAMGGGQIVHKIEEKLRTFGHSDKNISKRVFGYETNILRVNFAINKHKLIGQYSVKEFLTAEEVADKFDIIVGNPPYTDGKKILYSHYFTKALQVAKTAAIIMPVNLQSRHDKLKRHNFNVERHKIKVGAPTDCFKVGYDNISYVVASESVINNVTIAKDPVLSMPLLLPDNNRLCPIKGDTDIAIGDDVPNGIETIYKVHRGDNILYRRVAQEKVVKTNKKSTAPYLVVVNHTPWKGKFNCAVIPNTGLSWSMWTFVFEEDSLENAIKLRDWIQSPPLVAEIDKMLTLRNNQHTISKALIERLPYFK